MKLGPPLAMIVVLSISIWMVLKLQTPSAPATPGATTFELVIANRKVKVEQFRAPDAPPGEFNYRFRNHPDIPPTTLTHTEFESAISSLGDTSSRPVLLRAFNVTNYASMVWVGLGLGGQLLFSGRMFVQWLTSEKRRQSVVPPAFWYMSLGGGLLLAAYFIWRQDLIGVMGQSSGLVIYARNIRLLYKTRHPEDPTTDDPAPNTP